MNTPSPSATSTSTTTTSGTARKPHPSETPANAAATASTTNPTAKSTPASPTAESGIRMRGKYTFVTRCWLFTTLMPVSVTADEKNVHGTSPHRTNSQYGWAAPGAD